MGAGEARLKLTRVPQLCTREGTAGCCRRNRAHVWLLGVETCWLGPCAVIGATSGDGAARRGWRRGLNDGSRDQNHTRIRRGYAGIRGEYANRYSCPKFSMPSIREFAGQYQRLSKFTQIFTNTRMGYSPIRGHTRTFAQVHRDVSAYGFGHVSPICHCI